MQRSAASHVYQGGRFDFDDGGMYCGGWDEEKAHGYGVCTGLKGQGEYSGSWNYGFEVSGVYTWPGGSTYEGHWQNGKRHSLGVETRGRWIYSGEWTLGLKGRYGVRQSITSVAKYEGTWASGLQDGYGTETYADGGKYQGQWLRGLRHGYGVRISAPYGIASGVRSSEQISLTYSSLYGESAPADRGGFVLQMRSDESLEPRSSSAKTVRLKKAIRRGLRMKKQRSASDLDQKVVVTSVKSSSSTTSWISSNDSSATDVTCNSVNTGSNGSFVPDDEQLDSSVTETYMGEWKHDKRTGFGISERSDGLKYEGEWYNNKKYGYGVSTFKDGTKEEGKYKNNVLITSHKKKHLFLIRSVKFRERIDSAVHAAHRAAKMAVQKADIAISRTSTARAKAEQAEMAAQHARLDADYAKSVARQLAPNFNSDKLLCAARTVDDSFAEMDVDTPITATPSNFGSKIFPRSRITEMDWHQKRTNPSFDSGYYPSTEDADMNYVPVIPQRIEDQVSDCSSYEPACENFAQSTCATEPRRQISRDDFLHNPIPRRKPSSICQQKSPTNSVRKFSSTFDPLLARKADAEDVADDSSQVRLRPITREQPEELSKIHQLVQTANNSPSDTANDDDHHRKGSEKPQRIEFVPIIPANFKAWLERQAFAILVLMFNVSLAFLFFKLLT